MVPTFSFLKREGGEGGRGERNEEKGVVSFAERERTVAENSPLLANSQLQSRVVDLDAGWWKEEVES